MTENERQGYRFLSWRPKSASSLFIIVVVRGSSKLLPSVFGDSYYSKHGAGM
ncbi:MAG: hypothetical protein WB696_19585 [Chthoniobacterales bacterium]